MPIIFPLLKDWDAHDTTLIPVSKLYTHTIGGAYPVPDVFNLVMPNVDTDSSLNYKDFKFYCFLPGLIDGNSTDTVKPLSVSYLDPACYSNLGMPIVAINPTNTFFDYPSIDLVDDTYYAFTPVFKDLENLAIGDYFMNINFVIIATNKTTNVQEFVRYIHYSLFLTKQIDTSITNVITSPYVNDQGFTLDYKEFTFNSFNVNTYLTVDANIETYDFYNNLANQFVVSQKLVLYKNRQTLEFGSIVHKLMKRLAIDNPTIYQYRWASLQLDVKEKSITDNSVIRQIITNDIRLIAGLSKGKDYGFLLFNTAPSRATVLGYYFLNILIPPAVYYEIQVFKNNTLIDTIYLPMSQNKILCQKVSFEDYYQGDVIEYRLVETVSQFVLDQKEICIFPDGLNSYMIVWEDEFLLKSALECTGKASIKLNIESVDQKTYKNLVEKTETLTVEDESVLSINTGWLMKTDVDTVTSLVRAKRAWLLTPTQNIELRRATKSIITQNTDEDLIAFDLEFKINKQNNAETYSL